MRVGHGYDAHRFRDGDKVILGGVEIPHVQGLAAYSDGDVLLHAVCDALLGAAAFGDIGRHFPDSSDEFRGISSRVLLRRVVALLHKHGYRVANIDATVVAEQPRLARHAQAMVRNIAEDCGIKPAQVNVKATTTEGMGFTGQRLGIAAHAVALIDG